MKCREACGACCIAPSIKQPFFGMPLGKPAGEVCVHLLEDMGCAFSMTPGDQPCVLRSHRSALFVAIPANKHC